MKTNLLKSIFISLVLVMGVSNAWGKTIYLYTNGIGWPDDNAKIWVHAWGSGKDTDVQMTKIKDKLYKADISDADTKVIFTRTASSSTGVWNNEWNRVGEQALNDKTPCLKLTDWGTGTWGKISYDAHIYLDNSVANWSEATKEFIIGHSSYSNTYTMTNISNTKLYYLAFSDIWHGYWDYGFIGVDTHWGEYKNKDITHRIKDATKRTGTRGDQVINGTKLFVPENANNDAVLTKTDLTGYSSLNYTQTVQQHLSTDWENNYAASTEALATVTVSSYALNSESTTTSSSGTIASGNSSATCSAARTAIVTYTVSDVKIGYTFVGWYDGTTEKSTSTTYSYNATEAKTITARFIPCNVNDYRLVYIESEVLGKTPYTKFHPAQSIRGITEGDKLDTVSFFINKTNGKNPAILLQRCTAINGHSITWQDVAIQYINGNNGANPTVALAPAKKSPELYIGNGCPAVTKDAVYNFVLEQTNTVSHQAQILAENTHLYEGNYYIRTDGAAGGWNQYNTNPDNIMTYSQTALKHGKYDYYFCEWMLQGKNVKYVVANDYSYCVSDTLTTDDMVTDANGNLPDNANVNVRYTWNSSTNALKRAYINGSSDVKDRYLVLIGNEYLKDASGNPFPAGTGDRTGLNANETTFADMGNWIYQVDIKASKKTLVKLIANYNGKIQYFKGAADATDSIITGAENEYKFRLIYDFKTNYLLCGLTEDGGISEQISVDETMIMRSHHELAQTFNVTNTGSIKTIETIYGVMTFNKTALNDNTKTQFERALYWVSFPFDVDLGEAFGFGNYGEHWIMEYYDGAARAKNGAWVDSGTYWKYITNPKGYTLKAGEGYVLCLDLDLLHNNASVFHHSDEIALYFPSLQHNLVISNAPTTNTTNVTAHTCEINRPTPDGDRRTKDSNWNIIGIPCYSDIDNSTIGKLGFGDLQFLYKYNANNKYTVQAATKFNTMHAYMVQYAGEINWMNLYVNPAQMAARRNTAGKDQYTLRLALQQEDAQCDHTFIRLQEENATAEFDMNYDLCKIINSGANIYSMIGNVEVAANVLPVEERVIPLGLDIHKTGNYTFAMPDGTDGITAILIDYETGTETNLLLADYTTELREGTNNERFALRVRPNHVATEVENTILTDSNDNAKKYIIDGALYLLRDGKLYDAQGRMVQQ